MTFIKDQLKVALERGEHWTVWQLADKWLAAKGRDTILPAERSRLHTAFNERLVKLLKLGLAAKVPDVAVYRGQKAAGWSWDPTGTDLTEEY